MYAELVCVIKIQIGLCGDTLNAISGPTFAATLSRAIQASDRIDRCAAYDVAFTMEALCEQEQRDEALASLIVTLCTRSTTQLTMRNDKVAELFEYLLELESDYAARTVILSDTAVEMALKHLLTRHATVQTWVVVVQFFRRSSHTMQINSTGLAVIRKLLTSQKLASCTEIGMGELLKNSMKTSDGTGTDAVIGVLRELATQLEQGPAPGFQALFEPVQAAAMSLLANGASGWELHVQIALLISKAPAALCATEISVTILAQCVKLFCNMLPDSLEALPELHAAVVEVVPEYIGLCVATDNLAVQEQCGRLFEKAIDAVTSAEIFLETARLYLETIEPLRSEELCRLVRKILENCTPKTMAQKTEKLTEPATASLIPVMDAVWTLLININVRPDPLHFDVDDIRLAINGAAEAKLRMIIDPGTKKRLCHNFDKGETELRLTISLATASEAQNGSYQVLDQFDISFDSEADMPPAKLVGIRAGRSLAALTPVQFEKTAHSSSRVIRAKLLGNRVAKVLEIRLSRPANDSVAIIDLHLHPSQRKSTRLTLRILHAALELLLVTIEAAQERFGHRTVTLDRYRTHMIRLLEIYCSGVCSSNSIAIIESIFCSLVMSSNSNCHAILSTVSSLTGRGAVSAVPLARLTYSLCVRTPAEQAELCFKALIRLTSEHLEIETWASALTSAALHRHNNRDDVIAAIRQLVLSAVSESAEKSQPTSVQLLAAMVLAQQPNQKDLWSDLSSFGAVHQFAVAEPYNGQVDDFASGILTKMTIDATAIARHSLDMEGPKSSVLSAVASRAQEICKLALSNNQKQPHDTALLALLRILTSWCLCSSVAQSSLAHFGGDDDLWENLIEFCTATSDNRASPTKGILVEYICKFFNAVTCCHHANSQALVAMISKHLEARIHDSGEQLDWSTMLLLDRLVFTPSTVHAIVHLPEALKQDRYTSKICDGGDFTLLQTEVATSLEIEPSNITWHQKLTCEPDNKKCRRLSLADAIVAADSPVVVLVQNDRGEKFGGFISEPVSSAHVNNVQMIGTKSNFLFNLTSGGIFRSMSSRSGVRICRAADSPISVEAIIWGDLELVIHLKYGQVRRVVSFRTIRERITCKPSFDGAAIQHRLCI